MGKVEPLSSQHLLDGFNCGDERMNRWQIESALEADRRNTARTFVFAEDKRVLGYYALTAGSVTASNLPLELGSMPRHPIPVFLLARLAVDLSVQGAGYGRALVRDAVIRSLAANREIAGVCLMVEALNPRVKKFYSNLGFLESPISPRQMFFQLTIG